jgi:dolichol-phosphate mannosyltransferase
MPQHSSSWQLSSTCLNPMSNKQTVAIIIPSYNEAENLKILVKEIVKILPQEKIFIVDDSSEEEKAKLKKLIAEGRGIVSLISRSEKGGRGSAVILGLKNALADKSILHFIEMDADLSHNPEEISRLLQSSAKADVVLGSRYRKESKITNWPMRRIILSRIFNFFLNILLGLGLTDYTNGFRLYSRRAAKFLTSARLKEKGFISLSENAFKLCKNGFKFIEIPVSFTDRKNGKSNADMREHWNALYGALRIRFSVN